MSTPYTPFPRCLDVLIGFYNKIDKEHDKYIELEWRTKKREYDMNHDCVKLMNYIAFKLTYFSEQMRDMEEKLKGTFRDDCPRRQVRTIISPNGQTDWSRAVWCIYKTVHAHGFDNAWNPDVLAQMEAWLVAWTRSFPAKPAVAAGGHASACMSSSTNSDLHRLLESLHGLRNDMELDGPFDRSV